MSTSAAPATDKFMAAQYDWRPGADLAVLRQRADLYQQIRSFFAARDVLEVDIPTLGETGVTELHIDCLTLICNDRPAWLQSSPEYYLKRLLASGCGPVYSMGKVFRDGEAGRRHNPEFTMLEWYRPGWDEHALMAEVEALLVAVGAVSAAQCQRVSYGEVFQRVTGLDPHDSSDEALRALAGRVAGRDWRDEPRGHCLDLIFSLVVEPALPPGLVQVYDYPAGQAALAQLARNARGQVVARRFEAFLDGMELANGYFELTDEAEQRVRFEQDNRLRQQLGKPTMPLDEKLLAALRAGLPECAGVALGVDRLLMKLAGIDDIRKALTFPWPGKDLTGE